jgi:hypothetical protein
MGNYDNSRFMRPQMTNYVVFLSAKKKKTRLIISPTALGNFLGATAASEK